ncbi:MAG: L,D-transpeptidase family protein [Desulfobacter sp.]|nr:MAG: L,D-transpeptidase family protein [Desulfobacter sp.]
MKLLQYIAMFITVCQFVFPGAALAGEASLPAALILMPQNENAIIVEKKPQTLYVYSGHQDRIDMAFKVDCSTGEVAGPKTKAGDKKIPEGIYFLKDEFEDRYLTPVYGKKAFPSDYPNLLDLRQGKQGSAIWIHGTDKTLKLMDSNGCIALENENIMALSEYIHLDATPLIIVEQINHLPLARLGEQKKRILALIQAWTQALETGSYHQYLAFYDSGYLPDISWWESWLQARNNAKSLNQVFKIQLENTGIYT